MRSTGFHEYPGQNGGSWAPFPFKTVAFRPLCHLRPPLLALLGLVIFYELQTAGLHIGVRGADVEVKVLRFEGMF